jgi:hypothetical protein
MWSSLGRGAADLDSPHRVRGDPAFPACPTGCLCRTFREESPRNVHRTPCRVPETPLARAPAHHLLGRDYRLAKDKPGNPTDGPRVRYLGRGREAGEFLAAYALLRG